MKIPKKPSDYIIQAKNICVKKIGRVRKAHGGICFMNGKLSILYYGFFVELCSQSHYSVLHDEVVSCVFYS
jgi:hypothetical protein